jgi:hypothetical protein
MDTIEKDNSVFRVFPINKKHALHIIIKNGNNNVDTIINAGEWSSVCFTNKYVFIMAGIDTPYVFNADTIVYMQQALEEAPEEDTDDIK